MNQRVATIALVSFLAVLVSGCASEVRRSADAQHRVSNERISDVVVRLSPEAEKKLSDNPQMSVESLRESIRKHLGERDALDRGSPTTLDVVVTDFRVRSTFAAVMFGFMAGSDSLTGDVRVVRAGKPDGPSFTIEASYALGGLAGGQDGSRMPWLYQEFARHVGIELLGEAPR